MCISIITLASAKKDECCKRTTHEQNSVNKRLIHPATNTPVHFKTLWSRQPETREASMQPERLPAVLLKPRGPFSSHSVPMKSVSWRACTMLTLPAQVMALARRAL